MPCAPSPAGFQGKKNHRADVQRRGRGLNQLAAPRCWLLVSLHISYVSLSPMGLRKTKNSPTPGVAVWGSGIPNCSSMQVKESDNRKPDNQLDHLPGHFLPQSLQEQTACVRVLSQLTRDIWRLSLIILAPTSNSISKLRHNTSGVFPTRG